jgi:hypothetical protein
MYRREGIDRLDFNDHQVFDHQIHAIAEVEFYASVNDWKADLGHAPAARVIEFVLQAGRVGALEQTGTEFGVNSHCGSDDGVTDRIG